ncbi:hypothetical protein [Actinoplanes sp. NBRC 101535]|uniref:Panacea domain-containing protein n=1 Tax=Actinoplanes sp. NBRC 101535 TaxID=3032196 RepID=UPI0025572EDD|nr:hypothetical protein [Actinoplanes sp. NBRC 101535]
MTTSADSVIAAIDFRRPGLTAAKKHLLLFFAQGHHLAWSGQPLFGDPLFATDRGVALRPGDACSDSTPISTEGQAGTVTDVVVRYGSLSPAELRTLVKASEPWQRARKAGADSPLDLDELTAWFRRPDETDDPDSERPNPAERAAAEAYVTSRRTAS